MTRAGPAQFARWLPCWGCLTLAAAFWYWSIAHAGAAGDAAAGLRQYLQGLLYAMPVAGVAVLGLAAGRAAPWGARLAAAAVWLYLGGFAAAGWGIAPWAALGLAVAAIRRQRPAPEADAAMLAAHAMGTLCALYLVYSIERYLPEPGAVQALAAGFGALLGF